MSTTKTEYARRRLEVAWAIENHPSQFNMYCVADKSECGTTYCVAGWTLKEAGIVFLWDDSGLCNYGVLNNTLIQLDDIIQDPEWGPYSRWIVEAAKYLGLPLHAAHSIFHQFSLKPEEVGDLLIGAGYVDVEDVNGG